MAERGRPRNPELDRAAMSAAIRLIVEDGYPELTMDGIAERAAVSKAALYRRWPNKLALVVDAVNDFAHTQLDVPDTGRLRDDIVTYLRAFLRNRRAYGEAYDALIAAIATDSELARQCRNTIVPTFMGSFTTIVARAVERGELPLSTDVELYASLVPALIRHRRQVTGHRLDEALIERIAEQFFTAKVTT
jgi:AcrR family transcriptional regulator